MMAHGLLRDSVRRIRQGVLYFKNIVIFYDTRINLIHLRPEEKCGFSSDDFHKPHEFQDLMCLWSTLNFTGVRK